MICIYRYAYTHIYIEIHMYICPCIYIYIHTYISWQFQRDPPGCLRELRAGLPAVLFRPGRLSAEGSDPQTSLGPLH